MLRGRRGRVAIIGAIHTQHHRIGERGSEGLRTSQYTPSIGPTPIGTTLTGVRDTQIDQRSQQTQRHISIHTLRSPHHLQQRIRRPGATQTHRILSRHPTHHNRQRTASQQHQGKSVSQQHSPLHAAAQLLAMVQRQIGID